MRKVFKIEPVSPLIPIRKRVAAYARVSSGKEASLHSLSSQISYYSEYIQGNRSWEYVGVYADEAITGTKDNRLEFQRLITDCKKGYIDIVLTKSISRFARNTLDLLETVRELRELGVDIHFQQENISTMDADGELLLTILASFAQEESRSASENVKWRIRKGFEKGELINLRFMFGYRIAKGKIQIDHEEAAIVQMIFNNYIGGMGGTAIAKKLKEMKVSTVFGGAWNSERVISIIKNEKYAGNALLQKKYVLDHLSKKLLLNKGELPMYFAEGTHEAIIDTDTFNKAQEILKERSRFFGAKGDPHSRYPFSGIIECKNCGKHYKRKTKNKKAVWQCSTYLRQGKDACPAKQIPEDILFPIATKVLGIDKFKANIFKEKIKKIIVSEPNKLTFIFVTGDELEVAWQNCSRADSWTNEMKEAARKRQYTIQEGRSEK